MFYTYTRYGNDDAETPRDAPPRTFLSYVEKHVRNCAPWTPGGVSSCPQSRTAVASRPRPKLLPSPTGVFFSSRLLRRRHAMWFHIDENGTGPRGENPCTDRCWPNSCRRRNPPARITREKNRVYIYIYYIWACAASDLWPSLKRLTFFNNRRERQWFCFQRRTTFRS